MKKILIFSGTTEGRCLAQILSKGEICSVVCVATEYGDIVMPELKNVHIHQGRMDQEDMVAFMRKEEYYVVVDATHPFAVVASENIKKSAKETGIPYLRLKRDTKTSKNEEAFLFQNVDSCIKALEHTTGNILLTTGSKELAKYCVKEELRNRIYARVLPGEESIALCKKAGIKGKQIIAIQGPFSEELNIALMHQYNIRYMVTKESGRTGGFFEKVSAAKKAGVKIYVIGNPEQEQGLSFTEVIEVLKKMTGKEIGSKNPVKVSMIGIGMGNRSNCTVEGLERIEDADVIFGAKRLTETVSSWGRMKASVKQYPYYLSKDIIPIMEESIKEDESENIVILFSGDSGFYSGSSKLYTELKKYFGDEKVKIDILPGISSISYFAAKCKMTWHDASIISIHGKGNSSNWKGEVIEAVKYNKKVFLIVSGVENVREIATILEEYGLGDCKIIVGYQLSYPEEIIQTMSTEQCRSLTKEGLYTIVIKDHRLEEKYLAPKNKDREFIRGKIPMSKEEIRSTVISKLQLTKNAIVYDIGSGTGSVAVEIAERSGTIKVYAVERKKEGADLIRENRKKFRLPNIEVIEGTAPEILKELPAPTHVFIGGSGGRLKDMIEVLYNKNTEIKIVVTAVSMETIKELTELLEDERIKNPEIIQMQLSRSWEAGSYHLMKAENPVFLCDFNIQGEEREEK